MAIGPAGSPSSASVGVRPNAARPLGPKPSTTTSRVAAGRLSVAGPAAEADAVSVASGGKSPCAVTRTVFTAPIATHDGIVAGRAGTSVSVRCGAEQPAKAAIAHSAATRMRTARTVTRGADVLHFADGGPGRVRQVPTPGAPRRR